MPDIRPLPLTSFEEDAPAGEELRKAREVLQAALAEREKIREQARREGYETGLAEGRAAAAAAERERLARECAPLGDLLRAAARAVEDRRAELAAAAERELVKLSVRIAEKIVKAEVAHGRPVAADNLRRAVALAVRRRELRVRVHPEDLALIEGFLPELRRELGDLGGVALESDPGLARGGVVVSTPEGAVDADLRTQIEEIERGLLG
jgi:flagellar assembly protein FliH